MTPTSEVDRVGGLLSTRELARRSGASYRQLDYSATAGLLLPANGASGSGNARRYRPGDVERAERLARLSAAMHAGTYGPSLLMRLVGEGERPWVYVDGPLVITVDWIEEKA